MLLDKNDLKLFKEFYFYSLRFGSLPTLPGCYIFYFMSSGNFYIGSTKNIKNRFLKHKSDLFNNKNNNKKLQKCFNNALGLIYFYYKETENREEALLYEQQLITKYWNSPHLCNAAPTATDNSGFKFTEEQKKKLSEIVKNNYKNPKLREKIGKASKLVWKRPGHKEKMSQLSKTRWQDSEYREKQTIVKKEIGQRPEFKEKISNASKAT